MAEREFHIYPVGVDYVCDKCGEGLMEPHGKISFMSNPIQIPHRCNRCGHGQAFTEKYPTVRWKRQPDIMCSSIPINQESSTMKKLIPLTASLMLAACGGGGDDPVAEPISVCNGTPKAAVLYLGENPPAALADIPNACIQSAPAATTAEAIAAVDKVRTAAGRPRAYIIAQGSEAGIALQMMGERPGYVDIASLWMPPPQTDVSRIRGSLATIYLNGDCGAMAARIRSQGTPAVCEPATEFRIGTAIEQLNLLD